MFLEDEIITYGSQNRFTVYVAHDDEDVGPSPVPVFAHVIANTVSQCLWLHYAELFPEALSALPVSPEETRLKCEGSFFFPAIRTGFPRFLQISRDNTSKPDPTSTHTRARTYEACLKSIRPLAGKNILVT